MISADAFSKTLDFFERGWYYIHGDERCKVRRCFASFYFFQGGIDLTPDEIVNILEASPIIAATDSAGWQAALCSDAGVLFHLSADIMTVAAEIRSAKRDGKCVFVHIDLAEGIGKDKTGIRWLASCGADGIISTRSNLIRSAKECDLITVQRFFVLDTKGMHQPRKDCHVLGRRCQSGGLYGQRKNAEAHPEIRNFFGHEAHSRGKSRCTDRNR